MKNVIIKECKLEDAQEYTKHCIFHMKEKGFGGRYSHPFSSSHQLDEQDYLANIIKKWSLKRLSPGWEIAWAAYSEDRLVGHLNLRCGGIEAAKHRMRLGMGIEMPFRSLGIGKVLLKTALEWARNESDVAWIDLSVFANNIAAQKLYEGQGFKILYTIEDALRIEDEIYDDIQMVLKI